MLTAAKEGTFSASSDPCVLFPLAASGVYPKTRVWGSEPENVHCSSATARLKIELRWGCEESSEKTAVGSGVSFKYDPSGRRIYKSSSSGTSIYAYDGDNLIEETNSVGAVVARYSQGLNIDEPLAMLRSGATSYYQADGLGSLTSLSNTSGALANTYTYDSFGNLTASTGSLTNSFRYTGREFDTETSLYYYRARYYDTQAGRFLSEDPTAFNGGTDFYAYTRNSPISFVDPTGESIAVVGDLTTWITATLYLNGSPAAASIIKELQDAPEVYTINISDDYFRDKATDGKTVYWNPHKALCVNNGIESPAINLLHELEHLRQARHNQKGDVEGGAVKVTNPVAMQLGEPTRLNYADVKGHSTWPLPIPSSSADSKCKCQDARK
jgi:RHS repeat-associated protein